MRHQQTGRERCLAAHRDVHQGSLGQLYAVGRRQDQGSAILLEHDQAHAVSALVGVHQQRENRAFGRIHAFGHCHRPGGVHQEEYQVGDLLDAHLALQVASFNGKGQAFAFLDAAFLIGRSRAEGGVKGDIIGLVASGARLDIASMLALSFS